MPRFVKVRTTPALAAAHNMRFVPTSGPLLPGKKRLWVCCTDFGTFTEIDFTYLSDKGA